MNRGSQRVLKRLAETNLRGTPVPELVCEIQALDEALSLEDDQDQRFYYRCRREYLLNEFIRRDKLQYSGIVQTNREIIETIKDRIAIEDVMEWYGEVTVKNNRWAYRCTLHGEDKHPSGVIYREEKRWWCFGCNQGGDIFNAVQVYERVDMMSAIKKLARYIGLDLTPFSKTTAEYSDEPKSHIKYLEKKLDAFMEKKKKKEADDIPF